MTGLEYSGDDQREIIMNNDEHDIFREIKDQDRFDLADRLHDIKCHANHIDGCGYEYSSWDKPNSPAFSYRKRWLDIADTMLTEYDFEDIMDILEYL